MKMLWKMLCRCYGDDVEVLWRCCGGAVGGGRTGFQAYEEGRL
jgi:hypothetical protein